MKMLAISCASSTRPPPLARRSSTIPRAPCVQLVLDGFAHFAVRARAERGERDDAELDAVDGARRRGDDRLGDRRARERHACERRVRRAVRCSTCSCTSVPGRPLISAVAVSADSPASLRPLTATITSPAFSPARAAGEESNTRAIGRPRLARGRPPRRSR